MRLQPALLTFPPNHRNRPPGCLTLRYPSLLDRVVFVTGGGSGIGAGIVEAFVAQKANVAFVDLAVEARRRRFVAKLGASGPAPLFLHCDLGDIAALETAIEERSATAGAN